MSEQLMHGFPPSSQNQVTLANWREPPYSRWGFHHVREVLATANIANDPAGVAALPGAGDNTDLLSVRIGDGQGGDRGLDHMLEETCTDGFLVLHKGAKVLEWSAEACPVDAQHIVFSVSKSMTSILTGILVGQGLIDPDKVVSHYIPEVKGSAYGDCTVRHVLDMVVGIDFEEAYLAAGGAFEDYRRSTGWNPVVPGAPESDLRSFLTTLPRDKHAHGELFHYVSPNSDLLGWIVERASGERFADVFSALVWQPLGAERDGYVTVDRFGAPRTAGGICVSLADLARFGEMVRLDGTGNGKQIVPESWIADLSRNGSQDAWQRGSMAYLFPNGRYRSKWYQTGNDHGAICAVGIHGQWIYIDPVNEVTVVRTASQPLPLDDAIDLAWIEMFDAIARSLG